jgi:hypothetical protein
VLTYFIIIALGSESPSRYSIHTGQTEGNDYGKDLLLQHHEQSVHMPGHGHPHSGQDRGLEKRQ